MTNTLRFLILHLAFFVLNFSFASAQEIEWQNTIGGSGDDQLVSIQQTADGGYILGGSSRSDISGDKTENSIGVFGYNDYWMVKTDAQGNIQWQNTIGGIAPDWLASIQQTTDGGYILGGSSSSNISGDKTENCMGATDYWIVKTDVAGNIQWQNTIGGNNEDYLNSIQQTVDGGYILSGYSNSYISGDKTENCNGQFDYWIIKTDATGNIQWQNTIGGSGNDWLTCIHQTVDGGFILAGYSGSDISGDKTENRIGVLDSADYWIVKTDSVGNILWQNTIGGNYEDYLYSIQQTVDGGYILGGHSGSEISGDKTEDSYGSWDYWIVKTDAWGSILWQNTIGGPNRDYLYSIKQTYDEGYILGGMSESIIAGDKTENSIGDDYWIVKTDAFGNLQWQNTITGIATDILYSINQTIDGGYILGGASGSNISGDKTENCIGGWWDYWMIKIGNKYNFISGNIYTDLNSNIIKDVNEPAITQHKVTEQNTGRFAFTEQNGNYNLAVFDTGNFIVTPNSINYYSANPINHILNFTGINQIDSLNNFAFQAGVLNDLCISLTPQSAFRPGFSTGYMVSYENLGTTNLNGSIKIFPDTILNYVSSSQLPVNINADSIEWNVGTLTPFQSGVILVTFNVSSTATIGTTCTTSSHIEPISGDANPSCNFATSTLIITAAYDPNDILVSEDTLLTTQLPSAPWLDYTIRFQNTGNDTAFAVKVLNPIDTNFLNLSSIEFVNSSHPVNLNYIPWERNMQFTFNNILLPDSNINEPLSHGFVHYRIKPKTTLQSGDSILNNAFIYFDFNAPVATNTVATHIVLPTSIYQAAAVSKQLLLFPNPAANEITISGYPLAKGASTILKIIDVMGKEVYSASITTSNFKLQTLNFPAGVYFVQVGGGNSNIARAKFIKQ